MRIFLSVSCKGNFKKNDRKSKYFLRITRKLSGYFQLSFCVVNRRKNLIFEKKKKEENFSEIFNFDLNILFRLKGKLWSWNFRSVFNVFYASETIKINYVIIENFFCEFELMWLMQIIHKRLMWAMHNQQTYFADYFTAVWFNLGEICQLEWNAPCNNKILSITFASRKSIILNSF